MKNLTKNIARLLFAGVLILPFTFWMNIFTLQSNHPIKSEPDYYTIIILFIADGFLILYQFVMVVFDVRSQTEYASQFVKDFAKMGLVGFLISRYNAMRSRNAKTKILFTLFGLFIFAFVSILTAFGTFDKQTLNFYDLVNSTQMNRYDTSKVVYYFNYFTINNDTKKYVADLLKLSKDFKKVGVKAVVTDWPGNITARDTQLTATVERLMKNYNVFFANYPENQFQIQKLFPSQKQYAHLKFPLGFSIYSSEEPGILENQYRTFVKWFPYRHYRQTVTDMGFLVESDVALAVAEKYFSEQNYSFFVNHFVKIKSNQIISENFTIPVTSDGVAFSKLQWDWLKDAPVSASHGVGGYGQSKDVPDSLVYHFQIQASHSSYTSNQDTLQNFLPFEKYFNNKIVVINWIDISNGRSRNLLQKFKVGSIINATILSQNYVRFESTNYAVTFFVIVLIGLVFYQARLFIAIVSSFFLNIVLIGFGIWLFLYNEIIFDVFYSIIAVILSMVIFWMLKLMREIE